MNESSIWEHLEELVKILRKIIYVFIISFGIFFILPSPDILKNNNPFTFIYEPLIFWIIRTSQDIFLPDEAKVFVSSITAPFFVLIQVAFMFSLVITVPYAIIEIYKYIAPALYKHEKRIIKKYMIPFGILYIIGIIFSILVVLPLTFRWTFYFFKIMGIEMWINLNDFINIIFLIPILGGLFFCLPIFILPLIELGVLKTKTLSKNRILIYLIIAFILGLISPDPTFLSLIPILIPIYILYESTIWIGKYIENKKTK